MIKRVEITVKTIKGCADGKTQTHPLEYRRNRSYGLFSSSFGLFGGSFRSFGIGGCGSSSGFGFLLSYELGFSLVLSCFGFETLFCSQLALLSHRGFCVCCFCVFFSLPFVETTFGFSLVESAFGYAAHEVVHQHHTFARKNGTYGVGGFSTNGHPIQSTLEIECNCSRISVRIIRTYPFNKSTISWCPAIGDDNRIERIVLATMAL